MGGNIKKEYLPLNKGTVLSSCAKTFLKPYPKYYQITDFIITCPKDGKEACEKAVYADKSAVEILEILGQSFQIVEGADTRQGSVFNALKAIRHNPQYVLIHDGARPFVSEEVILEAVNAAVQYGAAVPGFTPVDTQKEIDDNGFIVRHLQRSHIIAVQTPQVFNYAKILEAHQKAAEDGLKYTDDTEIWGKYCGEVKVTQGEISNKKITYPGDL